MTCYRCTWLHEDTAAPDEAARQRALAKYQSLAVTGIMCVACNTAVYGDRRDWPAAATLALDTPANCEGFDQPCQQPGQWRRQNTRYENWRDNWRFLCPDCQAAADEHWAELWAEYYAGCL